MAGLFTLQSYSSNDLDVHLRYETPQAMWWLINVESDFGDTATAHCVVLEPAEATSRKGIFATNGVWEGLALGRFVRDVCWELFDEEEVDLAVFASVPDESVQGVISWPADGQQVFLD